MLFIFVLIMVFINQPINILSQEFQWTKNFNQTGNQDIEAFKTLLADRFNKRRNHINEIFQKIKTASDTYMAFKLSEMSGRYSEAVEGKKKKRWWNFFD